MRYAFYFALSIVCLTAGALLAFDHISVTNATTTAHADTTATPFADTLPAPEVKTPAVPTAADYARFADADREWRQAHARSYTLDELRALGDGKRSARDSVQDRVFDFIRAGQRRLAIAELERWVATHASDSEMLLSLARLLSEDGRSDDAVKRYRQILALRQRGH